MRKNPFSAHPLPFLIKMWVIWDVTSGATAATGAHEEKRSEEIPTRTQIMDPRMAPYPDFLL